MRYCMDCEHYRMGGFCGKDGKVTGALKAMCGEGERPIENMAENKKLCRKCGRLLPMENFTMNRRNSDGKQCYCKECANKARKSWYDKHIKA